VSTGVSEEHGVMPQKMVLFITIAVRTSNPTEICSVYQFTFCSRESHVSQIYISTEPHQLPIIYQVEYNVHFGGIEKLRPFNAAKWGHIFQVGCILLYKYIQDHVVCTGMYIKIVSLFLVFN
jgi:hypothetical protein